MRIPPVLIVVCDNVDIADCYRRDRGGDLDRLHADQRHLFRLA